MGLTRRTFAKNLFVSSLAVPILTLTPQTLLASVTYVVKSGDTLSRIAQHNGTTVAKIKQLNQLKSDLIKVGQKLQLPDPQYYSYRNPVRHLIHQNKKIKVDRKKWQIIVVHHSATNRGNASMFDTSHRKRGMQNGLAYHFVIGNGTDTKDGQIEMGSRWLKQLQGGHVKNHYINEVGIGICLVGNFENNKPTARQLKSLTALIDWLQGSVLKKRVKFAGHKDIEKNLCPGKNFPLKTYHRKYSGYICEFSRIDQRTHY